MNRPFTCANCGITTTKGANFSLAVLLLMISGCGGWLPGRQDYWDGKVKEMCAKDGGVTVFEQVTITRQDALKLFGGSFPTKATKLDVPYYGERIETEIRHADPRV